MLSNLALAQTERRLEYFFDDDPGFGNATEISISPGQQDVTFRIPLSDLSYGFHTLFLRAQGDSGRWSSTYHRRLLVDGISSKARMVRLEYFLDEDPGYGSGHSIAIDRDSAAVFVVDLTGLAAGFHQLYLRGMTENGAWSATYSKTFWIDQLLNRGAQKIIKAEYFIDTDPGFGTALPIVLPNEIEDGFTFSVPLDDAVPGFRNFYVRAMTEDGIWSTTHHREVLVESLGQIASDIDLVEYFIDVDPGYGQAIRVPATPSTTADLTFTADLSKVEPGFHNLYVRARDSSGNWSTISMRQFFISSLSAAVAQDIYSLEYFFDHDPGYGQGVQVPVTPGQNVETKFIADLTHLDSGSHTIYIRAKDVTGRWSNVFLSTFNFGSVPEISNFSPSAGVPGSALTINGFNFGATPEENQVLFNNVPVGVLNASTTSVEVEVPSGYFGPVNISVAVGGIVATASERFHIIRNQPIVTSIEPEAAVAGDIVTISGDHFGLNTDDIRITLGDKQAEVLSTTGQTIQFRVPDGIGGTVALQITVSGVSVEVPFSYAVSPPASNRLPQITHSPVVTSCLGVDVTVFVDVFDQTNQVQRVVLFYRTAGSENWSQSIFQRTVENTYRAVIPAAFVTEAGTEYYIQAFDDYQASSSTPVTSILKLDEPRLTSPAIDLTPEMGVEDLDVPIRFTWRGSPHAVSYDFYIWPADETRPSQPTAANLNQMVYIFNNWKIQYGVTYSWQVVSKDGCTSLPSEIQEITFRQLPDLVVRSVKLPGTALSEDFIEVQWEIENTGEGGTGNSMWYESIYLSQEPNFDLTTADFVKGVAREKALEPDEAYSQTTTIQLPRGIAGEFYVFVIIDRSNQLQEAEKNNNSGVNPSPVQVTMRPTPDLEIGPVIVSPRNTFSEQKIAVQWRIENKGPAKTESNRWVDDIYLSEADEFNPANSQRLKRLEVREVLQPGDSYVMADSVTLPRGIDGRYFIYVHTNSLEQVFEPRFNNISRSDSMNVRLLPPPDLTVSKIELRETASNNESISVYWEVENQGPGGIGRSMWMDRVYLSTSADGTGNLASLGDFSSQGELAPGAKYQQQANILIPQRIKGPYYLVVQTDVQNQVYEHNYEDNNMRVSENPINVLVPDIAVTGVQSPATGLSGQPLQVNWTLENIGEGAVVNRNWRETVYLSESRELTFEAIQLGGINVQNSMIAGSSLSRTLEARLPEGLEGTYYVIVAADQANQLFEDDRKVNNTLASDHTVEIELSPWADLAVSGVDVPLFTMAGLPIDLSYTIQNLGSKDAEGAVWIDRVYISLDSMWNPARAHLLTEINRSQGLTMGGTYSVQTQVTLPLLTKFGNDIHDAHGFIHVFTDAQNAIYEFTGENNNGGRSNPIYLTNPPPVNLRMEQVASDRRHLKSGESLRVTWSVSNTGNATDVWNTGAWNDGIFLSTDSIWDAQDIYVAQQTIKGPILEEGSYESSLNFRLPNGVFGEFYLLVVADYRNVNNDADLRDNYRYLPVLNEQGEPVAQLPVTIDLSASPDLVLEAFDTPVLAVSGQPIAVSWAVSNQGDTVTTANSWADRFYLSTNFIIDGGDRLVGSKVQERVLGRGETYQDSLQLAIPPDAEGNYVLFLRTDDGNTMYEHNGKNNNSLFHQILVYKADPSDLIITNINSPDTLVAGDPVTVSYQIQNIGENIASGYTSEAVYFSKDSLLDVSDSRLGIVEGAVNLGPMAETGRRLTAVANNLSPGAYYLLVQADIKNSINETDKENNVGQRLGKIEVVVPQLTLGLERVDTLSNGLRKYYGIHIPDSLAKETLLLELKGSAEAINTMYLKHGEMPSPVLYDQKSSNPLSGSQEIVVEEMVPGDYYLLVTGQSKEAESQSIGIKASIVPFELRTVESSVGGNSGMVTIKLEGAKFTQDMVVSLEGRGGVPLQAARVEWKSSILAFATFDLNGATIGLYDVRLTKADGSMATKQQGFEVVPGIIKGLTVRAGLDNGSGGQSAMKPFVCCDRELDFDGVTTIGDYLPANTRPNRVVSMTFYIENNSNVDIPVLQRYLVSMDGAPLAYTVVGLDENKQEVFLEFRESDGPEHVLRPGSRSEITVYSRAVLPLRFQMIE